MENNNVKQTISVIIPALNEEDNIESAILTTLAALDYYKIDGEIIVVNDGSTDRTIEITKTLARTEHRIKLINHGHPLGIGASFLEGVQLSQCDIVTMQPGDNENDPFEILCYFELLKYVDIVVPFVYNTNVRNPLRNFLSSLFRSIINLTFQTNFNYTNGTVIYRRILLSDSKYKSTGFFFQAEILIKAVKKGYLFAEVPYRLQKRKFGKSKAIPLSSFIYVAGGYLQLIREIYFSRNDEYNIPLHKDSISAERRSRS